MKAVTALIALLGSSATLVCCFLPAVLVLLGFGATLAGLVGTFPALTWLSEHKAGVFATAGGLLLLASLLQYRTRSEACPTDPKLS